MVRTKAESLTFIFGDATTRAAQEAIRVHVMRRQHRQRRENSQLANKVTDPSTPYHLSFYTRSATQSSARCQPASPSPGQSHLEPESKDSYSDRSDTTTPRPEKLLTLSLLERLAVTIASERATIQLQHHHKVPESRLIRYYYEYAGESKLCCELFRISCTTTATFAAFLAMVAIKYNQECDSSPPVSPYELENLALAQVVTQISPGARPPSSTIILTVAILASLCEVQGNSEQQLQVHWEALRQMLDLLGGTNTLRQDRRVYAFLFYVEGVVLSRVNGSIGDVQFLYNTEASPAPRADLRMELLGFLRDISDQINLRSKSSSADDSDSSRYTADPGILHELAQPFKIALAVHPHNGDTHQRNKWCHSRLGVLVFIAAMALQSSNSDLTQKSIDIYQAITSEISERQRYRGPQGIYSEEVYYLLMLASSGDDETHGLACRVARIVSAIKWLETRDMHTCHGLLSAFLGYTDPFVAWMARADWQELAQRLAHGYQVVLHPLDIG